MEEFLKFEGFLLGNSVKEWLIFLLISVLIILVLVLMKYLTMRYLARWAKTTETKLDDYLIEMVRSLKLPYFILLAVDLAQFYLTLSPAITFTLHKSVMVATLIQLALIGNRSISFWLKNFLQGKNGDDAAVKSSLGLVSFIIKTIFYIVLLLVGLHNLGVNISALVAGLGVGGIAVALALQNILGDLFASLTIILDKPFLVGDVISVGDTTGEIEKIGLKTTRIRSVTGEQIIFSNADLLKNRIKNFKRMNERRIVVALAIDHRTSFDKTTAIPHMVRESFISILGVRFERAHLKEFAATGLMFEVVYWIESADYMNYMDIQEKFNLALLERFNKENVKFAYPTQTLFLHKE